MDKFITYFFLASWFVLEVVGSVFVGYWLLACINASNTLMSKIGLIGLLLVLTIITITFIGATFLIEKDKNKSKKLDSFKK